MNVEMLDKAIQEGYKRSERGDEKGAVTIWLETWEKIKTEMTAGNIRTLREFDEIFEGSEMVYNWVSDVESELLNVCWRTGDYCQDRIRFCEEVIDRTDESDRLMRENMRRGIADSYVRMGDRQKADALFEGWLKADPEWGWGWIGWSDSYGLFTKGEKDYARAEGILKQGLAVSGVRDRSDMQGRLMSIYRKTGRKDDADRVQEELAREDDALQDGDILETTEVSIHDNVLSVKTKVRYCGMGMPLEEWQRSSKQGFPAPAVSKKIGRNEPCPCGSRKKYKKCCLNSEAIVSEENAMTRYRFETGSYGGAGAFTPSLSCHKRNASGQWNHDYVLVCPAQVYGDELSAAKQAEMDLSEAAEKGNAAKSAAVMALALKARGYVLVDDFKVAG